MTRLAEDVMKAVVGLVLLPFVFQSGGRRPTIPTPRPCVPTAAMPIAGLRKPAPERMPTVKLDSARPARMPVSILIPCYLVDSLGIRGQR